MAKSTRQTRSPPRERGLFATATGLLTVAGAALGCQIAVIDLGSTRPLDHGDAGADAAGTGTGGAPVGPVTTLDCPEATEAEIQALYGQPCASTCAAGEGTPRVVGSSAELIAVTATRWRTCAGEVPWPAGVVGLEFQNGCTLFLLHDAPDGGVARGVLPEDQGTFNVIETTLGGSVTARAIELYFPTWSWRVSVTTSDCRHRMRLVGSHGGATDFAAITSTSSTPK